MCMVFVPMYVFVPCVVPAAIVLNIGIRLAATVFAYINFTKGKTIVWRHYVFPLMLNTNLALTPAFSILFSTTALGHS